MTTATHTPTFIDYDVVERLTQLLLLAAQRKRVVFYWQAVAACQGGDLDLVIRGHIQVDKTLPPSNDAMLNAISHVAQVCKDKAWPPLTTLITKDGKTVSTGFWTNSPLGDLSGVSDTYKRNIELRWRHQLVPDGVRLSIGGAALLRDDFLKSAPNATGLGDSYYGYTELQFSF